MNKLFNVCMHHNTIDELRIQGVNEEKLKDFDFDTIKEALECNYPFHKDNYIISQEDRESIKDEYGIYSTLAECCLSDLNGDEENLKEFIEY